MRELGGCFNFEYKVIRFTCKCKCKCKCNAMYIGDELMMRMEVMGVSECNIGEDRVVEKARMETN